MIRKTIAFTLAETLIVMGIIGVVSALTLPNLNSSTGEKEKVAKVKKIYQNLDDALGRAQAVYGPFDEWFQNDTTNATRSARFGERMTEFMKLSKSCGLAVNQGCWSKKNMQNIDGTSRGVMSMDSSNSVYKIILADGTAVYFVGIEYTVIIDIDGPNKGNNQLGKDVFLFRTSDGSVIPSRADNFSAYMSDLKSEGRTASGWILDYDNMDYLKLNSGGKCPNGTTPTEQNPRCK